MRVQSLRDLIGTRSPVSACGIDDRFCVNGVASFSPGLPGGSEAAPGNNSHLFLDLLSHGEKHAGFKWFRPWHVELRLFPAWRDHLSFKIPVPAYPGGYPLASHLIV